MPVCPAYSLRYTQFPNSPRYATYTFVGSLRCVRFSPPGLSVEFLVHRLSMHYFYSSEGSSWYVQSPFRALFDISGPMVFSVCPVLHSSPKYGRSPRFPRYSCLSRLSAAYPSKGFPQYDHSHGSLFCTLPPGALRGIYVPGAFCGIPCPLSEALRGMPDSSALRVIPRPLPWALHNMPCPSGALRYVHYPEHSAVCPVPWTLCGMPRPYPETLPDMPGPPRSPRYAPLRGSPRYASSCSSSQRYLRSPSSAQLPVPSQMLCGIPGPKGCSRSYPSTTIICLLF